MKATTLNALVAAVAGASVALAAPIGISTRSSFTCQSVRQKPLQLFPDGNEATGRSINVHVVDGKLTSDAALAEGDTYFFEKCPDATYMGFSADFSRNGGGSMGAPLENWGHLKSPFTGKCLQHNGDNTFSPTKCSYSNDASQLPVWWRLQEGYSVEVDWFPLRNESGWKYDGETPWEWEVPQTNNNSGVLHVKPSSGTPSGRALLALGTPYDN